MLQESRSSVPLVASGGIAVLVCFVIFLGLKFRRFRAMFKIGSNKKDVFSVPGTYKSTGEGTYRPTTYCVDSEISTNRNPQHGTMANRNLSTSMTHLHQPSNLNNRNLSASMTHLHQPSKSNLTSSTTHVNQPSTPNLTSSMTHLHQPSTPNLTSSMTHNHPPTNMTFGEHKANKPSMNDHVSSERFPTSPETPRNPLAGGHKKGRAPGSHTKQRAPQSQAIRVESSLYNKNHQKLAPSLVQLEAESQS